MEDDVSGRMKGKDVTGGKKTITNYRNCKVIRVVFCRRAELSLHTSAKAAQIKEAPKPLCPRTPTTFDTYLGQNNHLSCFQLCP